MPDNTFKVRIKQRIDTLEGWQAVWNSFIPLAGEVCIFEVPQNKDSVPVKDSVTPPQHISKTGDGVTTLYNLPWDSALAADVYPWAKAATKPSYTKSEVGLGNVTNESKETMFTNAALTGTPTAPTAAKGTNTTQVATTAFVAAATSDLTSNYNETIIGLSVEGQTVTYIKGDGSVHTFETQDTDTTYSLATDEVTGLTKLYATTGNAEDGTMTQRAIKTELDKKVGVSIEAANNTLVFVI